MNFRSTFLASVFLISSVASAQNLLVNGDFELSVPNTGTDNGWTANLNDGAGGWRSVGGNPNGYYILNSNGSGGSNPTIEQTVTGLTVGLTYRLQVDYRRAYFSSGSGLGDFGMEADGNLWEFDVINDDAWRTVFRDFVAASTTVTVKFSGERYGDTTPGLDNASLTNVVPEPTSMIALGLGALALFVRRARR